MIRYVVNEKIYKKLDFHVLAEYFVCLEKHQLLLINKLFVNTINILFVPIKSHSQKIIYYLSY
jgi:hypothetical protein